MATAGLPPVVAVGHLTATRCQLRERAVKLLATFGQEHDGPLGQCLTLATLTLTILDRFQEEVVPVTIEIPDARRERLYRSVAHQFALRDLTDDDVRLTSENFWRKFIDHASSALDGFARG